MDIQPSSSNYIGEYWRQSPFTWKIYFIISLAVFIYFIVFPEYSSLWFNILNMPEIAVYRFQIWRLFFSMFVQIPSIPTFINIFIAFFWIRKFLKQDDCSTIYRLFQVLLINFEINLVFTLIMLILPSVFFIQMIIQIVLFNNHILGWFPIILVYEFRNSAENPNQYRNFCYLPFDIKSKYYPWFLTLLYFLFYGHFYRTVSAVIVGVVQQLLRKKMFLRFPFCFYSNIQRCIPSFIKNRSDFVTTSQVSGKLMVLCSKPICSNRQADQGLPNNSNRSSNRRNIESVASVVQCNQQGVVIGGGSQRNFENFWQQNQQDPNYNQPVDSRQENLSQPDLIYGQVIENRTLTSSRGKSSENTSLFGKASSNSNPSEEEEHKKQPID